MIGDYLKGLIEKLLVSPAILSFRIVRQHVQEEDGTIRLKCRPRRAHKLEFAEYVQLHAGKIVLITYNYHWQDDRDRLVKRWDNVPHHKEIDSFPPHLHTSETVVVSSGPVSLEEIIRQIEEALQDVAH